MPGSPPDPNTSDGTTDGSTPAQDAAATARRRAKQLFAFLQAYANLRRSLKTNVFEEEWHYLIREIPEHPAISRRFVEGTEDETGPLLRVRRAEITRAPAPPGSIVEWIDGSWDEPVIEPRWHARRTSKPMLGAARTEEFDEDPARVSDREAWLHRWRVWAEPERPARMARRAYDELFKLKSRLDREGEQLELVFANGWVRLRDGATTLDYPILLQRAVLEFAPDVPEFRLDDADRDPELNLAILQRVPRVQAQLLARLREELDENSFHPFGETETLGWLGAIAHQLSSGGKLERDRSSRPTADPVIADDNVIILRRRSSGVPEAMARALRAIEAGAEVPRALWSICGVDPEENQGSAGRESFRPFDALLSKPANEEQIDLIRQLETRGAVLVQGPPGTGKSHTIANLIGHLVATGQRVLVTSHTTKALRVLRNHVVEILRPLCVSVLDNDLEGRRQLEEAISHIQSGLQSPSDRALAHECSTLQDRREHLASDIEDLRRDLMRIRKSEYSPILVDNEQVLPIEAAKQVRRDAELHSWIPGPVEPSAPLPLSIAAVSELYATNATLAPADEAELQESLPNLHSLLPANRLESLSREAARTVPPRASSAFRTPAERGAGEVPRELAGRIDSERAYVEALQSWQREAIASSISGDERLGEWREFAELLEQTATGCRKHRDTLIDREPRLPTGWRTDDVRRVLDELKAAIPPGERLGSIQRLLHPEWRRFLGEARVDGSEPRSHEDILALIAAFDVQTARDRLRKRWNAQTETFSLPKFEDFGSRPEDACEPFAADMRRMLGWWETTIRPLVDEAKARAFDWDRELAAIARSPGRHAELDRHARALKGTADALRDRAEAECILAARTVLAEQGEALAACSAQVARYLADALTRADTAAWSQGLDRLDDLRVKRGVLARRIELVSKIEAVAASWATAIRLRHGAHGASVPPGDPVLAWRWSQLEQELTRRSQLDERTLGQRLELRLSHHRQTTADLIDRRTWKAVRARTGLPQRQALVGWADLMRKVGKGTGKRAPMLLAEARKKLDLARDAVPVWIMPLARVFETINPETTRFDVVIIDEASQSDVTALFAIFLGARVVVVGDHEQVSPDAVGQVVDDVDKLIDQHLDAVPNARLYTGGTSIYDLARQSFPGQLRLTEHFRCVREIIEYSNRLSYNNEIKPLRESATALAPHLVEHIVEGTRNDGKQNNAEAEAIVCLIAAAIELPEYKGKTLGVVSLLGDEQTQLIDEHARRRLPPREYTDRRIVCGNAAQFQGDERDVMFLTMVDAPTGGPLPMRSHAMFKQRYNVAASRARDQLWLVHSLDPARDLQPEDLRYGLIRHVRDPGLLAAEEAKQKLRAESPFEAEVVTRLLNAGYRLRTQFHVGAFRIDIVVIGEDRRIALECDGEKFHPPEALEADLARQMVLERLGWKFIRLRGSRYYRDPERAMTWVTEQLAELQIRPLGPDGWDGSTVDRRGMELVERVRRRAAELHREWFTRAIQEVEGA